MENLPKCPMCGEEYTYEENGMFHCPMCQHQWSAEDMVKKYHDANGNLLVDGDSVSLIKDVRINGSATNVIKQGTKAKNIRLGEFDNDHDIACKIDGFGSMYLKTSIVKKI